MTPEQALAHFAAKQNWTTQNQLNLLLVYIIQQQSDDTFEAFLAKQAELELDKGDKAQT